ncbi:hypothetical protein BA188_22505 [Aeromonas hydrophila]|nr:hypothetical protein BA189_18345 [Aeromonas hydrophila]OFC54753.1 hypothetical protein BA188_22505 [Aeromonas hydrophila]
MIYVPAKDIQELPELGDGNPDSASAKDNLVEKVIATQAGRLGRKYGQGDEKDLRFQGINNYYSDPLYVTNNQSPSFFQQETSYLKQQVQSAFQAEANERANSLLGKMGSAEVELAFGDDFRLKRYSADVLVPLVDIPERMLFIQTGGRHDDSSKRTIVNFGVGQRHFFEAWMFGYNTFFDYDILRYHSRLGLGGEAWADYLKLSANVYTPLSSWKDSPDANEYLERAARGFDFNAKYYFPKYPQLGVSGKVEQYIGSEVDLVGNKQRERNPYAGTVGLEWQPMPLLKVGVAHREAKGRQSDTQVNVGLEWKLGSSLDETLDSASVAFSRQLQGMRHDLVERNNNIVLEYKEKERVVVVEHEAIAGLSGEVVQLSPTVNISNGNIVSWLWEASEPLLQGALSDANFQTPTLTLPILPPDVLSGREFTLFLTVTDELGRAYQSSPIPVVVRLSPEMLVNRLTVISEGHSADSIDSPRAEVLVEEEGTLIEFVLARQLKTDASSSVSVPVSEVVYKPLAGYHIEQLEGEHRRGGESNAASVWVNKLKVTPLVPGQPLAPEVLSFHAKGPAGLASGNVDLALSTVVIDQTSKPRVSNLRMAGKLVVGQSLTATYVFDANGGDDRDMSTYAWGNQGETTAAVSMGATVMVSGVVPAMVLTTADVGEVKEVSVQAKSSISITGNTVTVDATGKASDSNGGTGGGGSETEGGGKGDTVINPVNYVAEVRYSSSASVVLNGIHGVRPVAMRDEMIAYCQMDGESEFTPCEGRYTIRWFVRDENGADHLVGGEGGGRFTPRSQDQGRAVLVEVAAI